MPATRTQKKLIRLPAKQSSGIGSSIVRLWFALRAAVLRLAVSQLYFLVRHPPITVAARLAGHRMHGCPSRPMICLHKAQSPLPLPLMNARPSRFGQRGLTLRSSGRPTAAA